MLGLINKNMRDLILDKIQTIKDKEDGFKTEMWKDFYVGAFHISEFEPRGIPTDEMLFDFYNEVIKWYYTKK